MIYIPADLRQLIKERAGGCCEYCRLSETAGTVAFHIEHIIAVSHGGLTDEHNTAYSCSVCNRYKGSNIAAADPETGDPTFLYHPRRQDWHEHFKLDKAIIKPLTPEGRATIFVLHLNDPLRIQQREILLEIGAYPCARD